MISRILSGSRLTGLLFITLVALAYFAVNMTANKTVQADDLPVIHVSGNLENNETWTPDSVYVVDDTLNVPDDITLTISAGTIVKYTSGWNGGIRVNQGGTLDVNGTSGSPVTFTSIQDDSAGGDSGGDGMTTGSANDYSTAIKLGGIVSVDHATFRYGYVAIDAYCPYYSAEGLVVNDSLFNSRVDIGSCGTGVVTLQRNTFEVVGAYPLTANASDISGVAMSGANTNVFNGSGKGKALFLNYGNYVSAGGAWSVTSASGAILLLNSLVINGDLDLGQGVIVKATTGSNNTAITVTASATLDVSGSSGSPVVFTTIKDDSIGGDTGGDGTTSGSYGDYSAAIAAGGEVRVSYGVFKYAYSSVYSSCPNYTVTELTLEDNVFNSGVYIGSCSEGVVALQRNQFAVEGGYPIEVYDTELSSITLAGSNKNTFTGSGKSVAVYLKNSPVNAGSTWSVSADSGAVLRLNSIAVKGTLTIGAGMIVKADAAYYNSVFVPHDEGVLDVNGTTSDPVIFTSVKDDSVGGDTNGDGTTTGAIADYPSLVHLHMEGEVDITNAEVRYTNQAFNISKGQANLISVNVAYAIDGLNVISQGQVVFRGVLSDITSKGIRACNWNAECSVDAAYVDWGDDDGPFPTASDPLVCGRVTVSPWIISSGTSSNETFNVPNCNNTDTPSDALSWSISNFQGAVSNRQIDCSNGYQPACDAIEDAFACLGGAVQVAASTTPIPVSFTNPTQTSDTVHADAVAATDSFLQGLEIANPSSFSLGIASGISSVVNLFGALSNAYSNCAP